MLNKFAYSKRAEQDVRNIYIHSAKQWNIAQADKYDKGLVETLNLLVRKPKIGKNAAELLPGCRKFSYEHHVIFYKIRKSDIFIIRILHKRMTPKHRLKN